MSNTRRVRSLLRRTSHEIDEDVLAAIRTCDPATWPAIKRRARVTEDTLCEALFRLRVEKRLVAVRRDPDIEAANFYEDGRVWYVLYAAHTKIPTPCLAFRHIKRHLEAMRNPNLGVAPI